MRVRASQAAVELFVGVLGFERSELCGSHTLAGPAVVDPRVLPEARILPGKSRELCAGQSEKRRHHRESHKREINRTCAELAHHESALVVDSPPLQPRGHQADRHRKILVGVRHRVECLWTRRSRCSCARRDPMNENSSSVWAMARMRGSSPRQTRAAGYRLLAARINAERRGLLEMIEGLYRRRVDADCRRNGLTAWHAAIGDDSGADAICNRLVHRVHKPHVEMPDDASRRRVAMES